MMRRSSTLTALQYQAHKYDHHFRHYSHNRVTETTHDCGLWLFCFFFPFVVLLQECSGIAGRLVDHESDGGFGHGLRDSIYGAVDGRCRGCTLTVSADRYLVAMNRGPRPDFWSQSTESYGIALPPATSCLLGRFLFILLFCLGLWDVLFRSPFCLTSALFSFRTWWRSLDLEPGGVSAM